MIRIQYSEEVLDAIRTQKPVVALESTIISHGMPFPHNLEVAAEVENVIRDRGATPATIAIIGGEICVGLTKSRLEQFAAMTGTLKCSTLDLPFVISGKKNGATTVAATMAIAGIAGIRVFATGGIGGVHRNAGSTFDISADLMELSRTNVAVVSAGAKAILDLPKTLEYLETLGVPVLGYRTNEFPAFYSRESGLTLSLRCDEPGQIASFLQVKYELKTPGGVLIANPIPEVAAISSEIIEPAILSALREANDSGIVGKSVTPFLLRRLNEITSGKSQISNKALVLNNAMLAAEIAIEWTKIQ